MWKMVLFFWIFMVSVTALVGFGESVRQQDIDYLMAAFSGPFAEHVTGVFLSFSDKHITHFDFLPLSMLFGSSICFFAWKTRYAEFCAGLFFVLSMFVWFAESIAWLVWK